MIPPPFDRGWRKPLDAKAQDRLAVVMLLATCVFLGGVWHLATAKAATERVITVTVSWEGCAELTAPDLHNQDHTITAQVCDPPTEPVTYVVHPGQMYGAAVFSPGLPVSCRVTVDGQPTTYQAALGAVDCLDRY